MKKRTKKILAILLSVAMLVPTMPTMVFAESLTDTDAASKQTQATENESNTNEEQASSEQTAENQTASEGEEDAAPLETGKAGEGLQGAAPTKVETTYTGESQFLIGNYSDYEEKEGAVRYVYKLAEWDWYYLWRTEKKEIEEDFSKVDAGSYSIRCKKQVYTKHGKYITTYSWDDAGEYTIDSKINAANINNTSVELDAETFEWDGNTKKPSVKSVKLNGVSISSENYTVSGQTEATNPGEYTLTISGTKNLTGTKDITWKINKLSFSVDDYENEYTYDGTEHKPDIVVKNKTTGQTLTLDVDYEVDYKGKTNFINHDDYKATIKGIGVYEGEKEISWTIKKSSYIKDNVSSFVSENNGLVYNGKAQNLAIVSDELKADKYQGVKVYFKTSSSGDESTNIPTATNYFATGYPVFYRIDGGNNYESVSYKTETFITTYDVKNFTASIDKASIVSIELSNNEFTYDGTEKTVSIKKVMAGKADDLVECPSSEYYTDSSEGYSLKGTAVGTYKVKVGVTHPLIGNFTGTAEAEWKINKSYRFSDGALTIKGSDGVFAVTAKGYEFTGEDITITADDIKVEADGETLTKGVDYEIVTDESTTSAKARGTYTIKVKGIGDYNNENNVATAKWSITKVQLNEATLDSDSRMYDGTAFKPVPTEVKDTKGNTVSADSYTVSYKDANGAAVDNPTIVGTYKVVITAKENSNYDGSVEKEFTITKSDYLQKNASKLITGKTGLKYTGEEQELVNVSEELSDQKFNGITIKYKSALLEEGSTAIPTGKDAYVNAGITEFKKIYTVYFRIAGGNNYEDVDYPIESIKVTIDKGNPVPEVTVAEDLVYNGSAQQLVTEAKTTNFGTIQLNYKKDGDEDWALEEWVTADEFSKVAATDAGKYIIGYKVDKDTNWYAVNSVGKDEEGSYKHKEVTIESKALKTEWINLKNLPWTGDEQEVEITVTDPDLGVLEEDTDYTVTGTRKATAPGEYKLTVKGINNYKGEFEKTWKIVDLKAVLDVTEFTYDTKEHSVNVTVTKVNGDALKAEKDYNVLADSTFSAMNAGTYTVKVQGLGAYADAGIIELNWTIKPAELEDGDLSLGWTFFIYDKKEHSVTPSVKHRFDSTVELEEDVDYIVTGSSVLSETNSGVYEVTVEGTGNYTGETTEEWRIQGIPISHVITLIDEDTFEYNTKEQGPELSVGLGLLDEGEDYEISGVTKATDAGEYEFTVKGRGAYYGTITFKWKIEPKSLTDCRSVLINKETGFVVNSYIYIKDSPLTINEDILIYDADLIDETSREDVLKAILEGGWLKALELKIKGLDVSLARLEEDKDYEVTDDSVRSETLGTKGAYKITAEGIGNYTGSVSKTWVIASADQMITLDSFQVVNDKTTYSGEAIKPHLQYKDSIFTEWTDIDLTKYSVTDKDTGVAYDDISKLDAGTYTLVIEGIPEGGKYGTVELTWTIEKKQVVIKWDKTETVYNGEVQRPVLTLDGIVPADESKVTVNTAKAISLLPPRNADTYYMYSKVEFADDFNKDNYEFVNEGDINENKIIEELKNLVELTSLEELVKDKIDELIEGITDDKYFTTKFTIKKRPVGVVWSDTEFTYDGIKHAPTARPTKASEEVGDRGLIDGDYCVLTVDGWEKNAGTYTATASGLSFVTGLLGNYELDAEEKTCEYTIKPKNIGDLTVVGIQKLTENLIYNAETQSPTLSVTDIAITALDRLYEGTDYEIDKYNKSCQYEAVDAGDYKIIIRGEGNYTGTRSIDWDIEQRSVLNKDVEISLSSDTLVYNAKTQGPTVTFTYKGVEQKKDQYEISGTTEAKDVYNILGVTDYTMYISGCGNFKGFVQRDWDIVPLDLSKVTPVVSFVQKTYNGEFRMPEATKLVVNGDEIPVDETRFTLLSARKDAGEHEATLVGSAKLNQYLNFNVIGETVVTWEIQPKQASEDAFDIDMGTYIYNAEDQRANPTISDIETGETLVEGVDYDLKAVGGDQQVEANAAGTYELTISFKGNYKGSLEETWTIQQKDVTVTALDAEKYFDPFVAEDPKFEYETEGTVGGFEIEEEDVSFTRELEGEPDGELVGKYKITMSVAVDEYPNYDITLVNDAYLTIKAHEYKIIEGDGQQLTYGSDGSITFRANGDIKFFESVEIDGEEITDDVDYTKWPGSTYIKLEPAYVKTLAVGQHTITVNFMDGSCSGTFTITAAQDTGDTNNILLYALLLLMSVMAIAVIMRRRGNRA